MTIVLEINDILNIVGVFFCALPATFGMIFIMINAGLYLKRSHK